MKPRNDTFFAKICIKYKKTLHLLKLLLTVNQLTYYMQHSPFWNASRFSASQEISCTIWKVWDHGDTVAKVLCYKFEGRWFIGIFHWHNPSNHTLALGSTQPLTEMSTRSISWGQRWLVHKADNLTTILCRSHNLGTLTSWNLLGHSRPLTGLLYFFIWNSHRHLLVASAMTSVPVTTECCLRLQIEEQPPDMYSSCQYIYQAGTDSWQSPTLGAWWGTNNSSL